MSLDLGFSAFFLEPVCGGLCPDATFEAPIARNFW